MSPEQSMDESRASRNGSTRNEWDLLERVTALEVQLAERIERDEIRELEISSLRQELELRFSYNESLEQALKEKTDRVNWLEAHLDHVTNVFAAEASQRATDLAALTAIIEAESAGRRAAEGLLAAERARISYRVVHRLLAAGGLGRVRKR